MKLFLISQDVNTDPDTYDFAVVAAPDPATAKKMYPGDGTKIWPAWPNPLTEWVFPEYVQVKHIGEAAPGIKQGVICASFNEG